MWLGNEVPGHEVRLREADPAAEQSDDDAVVAVSRTAPSGPPPEAQESARLQALEARIEQQQEEIGVLRRKRDLLDRITGHMCDGLSVIDRNFVIRDANDAFIRNYGGSRNEIIGRTCHEVTHGSPTPCASANHVCPVMTARVTGEVARVEHVHVGENGAERIVEVTAIPVPGDDGQTELVVEVAHDVTDQRRATREASERERLEGVLAVTGAACHHLNQPTQGLLLGIEQLSRRTGGRDELTELVQTLRTEAERVAQITRQLQHVARCVTEPYYNNTNVLDLARSVIEPDDWEPSAPTDSGAGRGSAR